MDNIREGSIVLYTDRYGFKTRGKVISRYTSATGHDCVHINNFIICRLVSEIELFK